MGQDLFLDWAAVLQKNSMEQQGHKSVSEEQEEVQEREDGENYQAKSLQKISLISCTPEDRGNDDMGIKKLPERRPC